MTDARSEALVAFLTGPRPKNTAEAYQVTSPLLQAVVDGNDFDLAWRTTVCPALNLMGVRKQVMPPYPASRPIVSTASAPIWRGFESCKPSRPCLAGLRTPRTMTR